MFYQFDVNKWIIHLLPPILRKASIYAFLRCMLYPVKQLQSAFLAYKLGIDQRLTYNAFVDVLERFLNGLFFFEHNEIYITDQENEVTALAFADEDYEPVYMTFIDEVPSEPLILNSVDPSLISGIFVVHVPESMSQEDIATITNWVNYYKMAGTDFIIETYYE